METGNPKQVAMLAVLAIGAVGFLATRLGGKAVAAMPAATAATHTATAAHPFVALGVLRDPFSHPRLAQKPAVAPPAAPILAVDKHPTFSMIGALPSPEQGPLALTLPAAEKLPKASAPAAPPVPTIIGLEATASATDAIAFITVGGGDSQPFRPSDQIAGSIRLLSVSDGQVVLSSPKGKLTLGVGERKSL